MSDSSQALRSRVRAHVERELAPVAHVFHPSEHALDVLHVPASDTRPVQTLITAGISDSPMSVPSDGTPHVELMMTLPRHWKFDGIAEHDPEYWPIRTLATLARLAFENKASLQWGDAIANGEPAQPFARDTQLCGVIIAPSLLVPKEFYALDEAGHHVEFYAAIPLYREELALCRTQGMKHLLTTLVDHRITDLVDINRRNVARKRFGFF
jgi:hypothetical protein